MQGVELTLSEGGAEKAAGGWGWGVKNKINRIFKLNASYHKLRICKVRSFLYIFKIN
jgi:hypothetical protein